MPTLAVKLQIDYVLLTMTNIKNQPDLPLKPLPKSGKCDPAPAPAPEIGGRKGPDPARYGDWERNGKCVDF